MKLRVRLFASLATVLLFSLLILPSPALALSRISGSTHEWSTLDVMDPSVVEINTTPAQAAVTKGGEYSFDVPAGYYKISARYVRDGRTALYDEVLLEVPVGADGSYSVDLILFPPEYYPASSAGPLDDLKGGDAPPSPSDLLLDSGAWTEYLPLALAAAALALAALPFAFFRRRNAAALPPARRAPPAKGGAPRKRRRPSARPGARARATVPARPPAQVRAQQKPGGEGALSFAETLSHDVQEVLSKVEAAGGRISQRDLRRMLPYSEAKASLVISEMEARGLVRKFKRGRGNILILQKP